MDFVVTYDINTETKAGQKRLSRVAKVCESFGMRVQYSVFECRLSNTTHAKLVQQLTDTIDHRLDSVRLYRINDNIAESCTMLGNSTRPGANDPWIL